MRASSLIAYLMLMSSAALPMSGQSAPQPRAENRMLRLDQAGTGVWTQAARPDQKIARVTLGGNPSARMGLEFTLTGGGKRSLGVKLVRKGAYSLRLRVVDAGDADASGEMLVELNQKHTIHTLRGKGVLDGQRFRVRFAAQDGALTPKPR